MRRGSFAIAIVVLLAVLAAGCSQPSANGHGGQLARIKARGTLIVATRNAPTTYYLNRYDKPAGPEATMAASFARYLGVKVEYRIEDSITNVLGTLRGRDADIAAAGLTITKARSRQFQFGPVYKTVKQQVVCSNKGKTPRNVDQLPGVNLVVIADSSYTQRLQVLRKHHPKLKWRTRDDVGTEQLLREVARGRIDCTVADSDIVAINRRYYPNLLMMFDLTGQQDLAWAMPKDSAKLGHALQAWFKHYKQSGKLAAMQARYYGYIRKFNYVDKKVFVERIKHLYPKYAAAFALAGRKYNVPPLLLAAQAYQESHWNTQATSPTGVRGIMMLTQATAEQLGVTNRLNPIQSIFGGAKYLSELERRVNAAVTGHDRIYFALAAYNIGMYHMQDARTLALRLGKNPNTWTAMRTVLPLLANRRYYRSLKHGYARGMEPVRYVRRIRDYADVIRRITSG